MKITIAGKGDFGLFFGILILQQHKVIAYHILMLQVAL